MDAAASMGEPDAEGLGTTNVVEVSYSLNPKLQSKDSPIILNEPGFRRGRSLGSGLIRGFCWFSKWVVVKIMVPSWISVIIRHLIYRTIILTTIQIDGGMDELAESACSLKIPIQAPLTAPGPLLGLEGNK